METNHKSGYTKMHLVTQKCIIINLVQQKLPHHPRRIGAPPRSSYLGGHTAIMFLRLPYEL